MDSILDVIRSRKTTKVMSDSALRSTLPVATIERLLEAAHWAPFHKACDESHRQSDLQSKVPWRMTVVNAAMCRQLRERLPLEKVGKIPAMLAAAEALIQVTWLPSVRRDLGAEFDLEMPQPSPGKDDGAPMFEANRLNMEHIAAASAAIQNLLLAATAEGVSNYWSSGGVLRERLVFEMLGIPASQILLGSIFLFPSAAAVAREPVQVVDSKLRDQRGGSKDWARWVNRLL